MIELLHIPYSPWSEKARWALDARGVAYRSRYYQPLLGEPALRWRLKQLRGIVSAPVLFADGAAFADSFAIAKYAASQSGGGLIPADHEAVIAQWNTLSERGLAAGRALSLARVLESPQALGELVPKGLRKLGKVATTIARGGVKRTLRKYGANGTGAAEHQATLVDVLEQLRVGLAGRRTLLDAFSYADITMAQVLAFVRPPDRGIKIGAGNRAAFGDNELATRFADLLAWRDALYADHRGESQAIKA